jgi:hypothetical protein
MRLKWALMQAISVAVVLPVNAPAQLVPPPRAAATLVTIDGPRGNFSYFTHFAASGRGAIAVAQQQDGAVLLFNSRGVRVGAFGRKGEGPGEFRALNALGWIGDTLWVLDNRLRRITYLTERGTHLRTTAVPVSLLDGRGLRGVDTFRGPRLESVYPDGMLLMRAARVSAAPPGAGTGTVGVRSWLLRVTVAGEVEDVVAQAPEDPCHLRTTTAEMIIPLCPQPLLAAAPNSSRIAVITMQVNGARSTYALTVLSGEGDTVFTKSVPIVAEPVARAKRDSVLADLREGEAVFRQMAGTVPIATHQAPVSRLAVSALGDVWVGLHAPAGATLRPWQVFDASGRNRGMVWIPRDASPFAPEARGIWSSHETLDGVEGIRLYSGSSSM